MAADSFSRKPPARLSTGEKGCVAIRERADDDKIRLGEEARGD
jgi:hypothetical protein